MSGFVDAGGHFALSFQKDNYDKHKHSLNMGYKMILGQLRLASTST